jgi:hypothetical protein
MNALDDIACCMRALNYGEHMEFAEAAGDVEINHPWLLGAAIHAWATGRTLNHADLPTAPLAPCLPSAAAAAPGPSLLPSDPASAPPLEQPPPAPREIPLPTPAEIPRITESPREPPHQVRLASERLELLTGHSIDELAELGRLNDVEFNRWALVNRPAPSIADMFHEAAR